MPSSIDERLKELLVIRSAEHAAGMIPKRPRRQPRGHAKKPRRRSVRSFEIPPRVRVSQAFPDSRLHGLEGTLISVPSSPKNSWLRVRFDDTPENPVRWHRDYFDWAPASSHT